jgi:hypothetical protein
LENNKYPIKANLAKASDAKLWIFCHPDDNDRQATEDLQIVRTGIIRLACIEPGFLFGTVPEPSETIFLRKRIQA